MSHCPEPRDLEGEWVHVRQWGPGWGRSLNPPTSKTARLLPVDELSLTA